ncbi:unnamed protein product [Callosobruchus maculatus]|uniref:Uncharacterized protein n=1 Tax=Callosobruchus maculatus TaxID=64391 RepID=A0A653BQD4_CALMS|nr:unnamed protein product [Callosobruchus maculatus]
MRLLRNYSDCFFLLCISFYILFFWFVEGAKATQNSSTEIKSAIEGLFRGGREYNLIYARLIGCAVQQDTRCFVNVAEDFLENKRNELLAQADREILQSTGGRADATNSPSQLAKSIEKIIFELSSLFKNGLGGLLSPRDGEEDLEDEEESVEETKDGVSSRGSGKQAKQARKKKQEIIWVAKLLILAAIIRAKIELALKLYQAAIQTKIFWVLVSLLFLNKVRLFIELKKSWEPKKQIFYEHAQHDHHYDGDIWGNEEGGGLWG